MCRPRQTRPFIGLACFNLGKSTCTSIYLRARRFDRKTEQKSSIVVRGARTKDTRRSVIDNCQYLSASGNGEPAMNRSVINYLLHTTIKRAARQIYPVRPVCRFDSPSHARRSARRSNLTTREA